MKSAVIVRPPPANQPPQQHRPSYGRPPAPQGGMYGSGPARVAPSQQSQRPGQQQTMAPQQAAPVAAQAAAPAPPATAPLSASPQARPQDDRPRVVSRPVHNPIVAAAGTPGTVNARAPGPPASPTNVVRVIDADAIKARLAAEGRDFNRAKRPGPNRGPIREIKVVSDRFGGAPQMVDVSATPGAPGAARPSKGGPKGKEEGGEGRRDGRGAGVGGGRDLWLNPGKKRKSGKKGRGPEITQAAAHKRVVEISDLITVGDLAHQMAVKSGQVISKLFSMGMMVTVNQTIDFDTASLVATEFGFEVKNVAFEEKDLLAGEQNVKADDSPSRSPVVTVMGHVDHGKTSLLDTLRSANVAAGEAGGITQHIGAYSVETPRGRVTFLDTPGHAAFTAMRQRGAQVTDIVVLVVAADDGVMPQTVEAIKHAKAAKVPLIVAINKIDKPDAKPERVMQQLTEHGLVPEDWGGETMMVPVSARKGLGIDDLLERILLQAEILDLRASTDRRAEGTIVEAELDKGRGPVATVLVQSGTLRTGDFIVAGEHAGKVRAMYTARGEVLKEAGPSTPVQVLGLSGVPNAGDRLNAVADDKTAKTVAEHRSIKAREEALKRQNSPMSNLVDFLGKAASVEEFHELRVIVKADVGGSVEAVSQALERLSTRKVKVNVVRSGVGTITESDLNDAMASRALVVGFNSKPDAKAQALAAHEKVDVRTYSIIYELIDDVRVAMVAMLAPKFEERYMGRAEVRALFTVPKLGLIAGSYVVDGKIMRTEKVRVRRGPQIVHEGNLGSLRRFKDDVKEVAAGYECGIGFQSFTDVKEGDVVECFAMAEVAADLGEPVAILEEREREKKASASVQPSA